MPKIGVIIPVYNVEKYLEQCIKSIINQNFEDMEILLIDDGSTDSSGRICDEYKEKDSRIKVIHKKNGGLSDARNAGIKEAIADYLLFLDSDDYWMDNSLNEINKCITDDTEVIFLSMAKFFDRSGTMERNFEYLDKNKIKNKSKKEVFKYLSEINKFPASACTKLVSRKTIIDNNLFFEKGLLSEDIDWSIRLLLCCKQFDVCNVDFYIYRKQQSESITSKVGLKNVEDLLYIIEKWVRECRNEKVDSELSKYLLGVLAYEYIILMAHLYSINKVERKIVYKRIRNIKYILNYSNSKKTIMIRNLVKIIGFNLTAILLKLFIVIRRE